MEGTFHQGLLAESAGDVLLAFRWASPEGSLMAQSRALAAWWIPFTSPYYSSLRTGSCARRARWPRVAARMLGASAGGDGLFFFFWMLLGAFWFVEAASRGSFGSSVLVIVVMVTGSLLAYRPARRAAAGALVGAALPVLLQAYLLRKGPGIVCSQVWLDVKENCRYMPDPLPWTLAGILLVIVGVAVQRRVRATSRAAG